MLTRAPDSARDFAALALSVLLERVGSTARELSRLSGELVALPVDNSSEAPHGLGEASLELERLGWLFGLLARELGSDVLFQRRERHGLECALALVRDMLAREGVEMHMPALPQLDAGDEQCTTICAVVARCVHAAHVGDPTARWGFERIEGETALCFQSESTLQLDRALRDGAVRIAGSRHCREREHARLFLPPNCAIWP